MNDATYVLTLQLDPTSFEWLQALRSEHFPKARNWLPAHLTLLHVATTDQINRLKRCTSLFDETLPLPIRFTGIRSLGGGTAFDVDSSVLNAFRHRMMQEMRGQFSAQDSHRFKAHVTIQNKVGHVAARTLQESLSATFVAREGTGLGVMIWRYLNGPWSLDAILPFKH